MKRTIRIAFLCCFFLISRLYAQAPHRFETEIREFERRDSIEKPAPGQILLYGSSTMRLWTGYKTDLAGYSVQNRGFGGSEMEDAVYFFDRVVLPLHPSWILLYEGDNDLANGHKSPGQIAADFRNFLDLVKQKLPGTKVAVYTLRPSLAREQLMPQQRQVNALFRKICRHRRGVYLINAWPRLLDASGRPAAGLLSEDKLHLNEAGYRVWTEVTRAFLRGR